MNTAASRNAAYGLALAIPVALIAAVYVAQYGFGLAPCEMCWWQRYPHFAAIVLALGAFSQKDKPVGDMLVRLAAVAIGISGLIGAFHAGVEYHWWEGITTCSSSQLGNDPLAAIMAAPVVRCDAPAWTLFGISLAGYNFIVSFGAALLIFAMLGKGQRA